MNMILYNHRLKSKRKSGWYVIDKRKITEKVRLVENEAAQALNVTEGSAAHDATAKKLLANKAILSYIIKSSLEGNSELYRGKSEDQPDCRAAGLCRCRRSGADRIK